MSAQLEEYLTQTINGDSINEYLRKLVEIKNRPNGEVVRLPSVYPFKYDGDLLQLGTKQWKSGQLDSKHIKDVNVDDLLYLSSIVDLSQCFCKIYLIDCFEHINVTIPYSCLGIDNGLMYELGYDEDEYVRVKLFPSSDSLLCDSSFKLYSSFKSCYIKVDATHFEFEDEAGIQELNNSITNHLSNLVIHLNEYVDPLPFCLDLINGTDEHREYIKEIEYLASKEGLQYRTRFLKAKSARK